MQSRMGRGRARRQLTARTGSEAAASAPRPDGASADSAGRHHERHRVLPNWVPNSLLSIPLTGRQEHITALNLYSTQEGLFSRRDDVDYALVYAIHASHALAAARPVKGLELVIDSRHDIGVALGIIMESYGVTMDRRP